MNKILILYSGLKESQMFMNPYIDYLRSYLDVDHQYIDIRDSQSFDPRSLFEYNQLILVFMTTMNSVPSTTLEIFDKLESIDQPQLEVYAMIACDEYEPEKCSLSQRIVQNWCHRQKFQYKGCLCIGSALFILQTYCKFLVANNIKKFSNVIHENQEATLQVSLLNERTFMKHANKYWKKEIKNYEKKLKKES